MRMTLIWLVWLLVVGGCAHAGADSPTVDVASAQRCLETEGLVSVVHERRVADTVEVLEIFNADGDHVAEAFVARDGDEARELARGRSDSPHVTGNVVYMWRTPGYTRYETRVERCLSGRE